MRVALGERARWDDPRRNPSRRNILLQVSRSRSNVDVSDAIGCCWLPLQGATVTALIQFQMIATLNSYYTPSFSAISCFPAFNGSDLITG